MPLGELEAGAADGAAGAAEGTGAAGAGAACGISIIAFERRFRQGHTADEVKLHAREILFNAVRHKPGKSLGVLNTAVKFQGMNRTLCGTGIIKRRGLRFEKASVRRA